jgi:hypothetical protein
MRLSSGEYLILVSNDASDQVLEEDKQRWKIAVLFQALQSRGFHFAETH